MMPQFLLFSASQAAALVKATEGREAVIEPREISAGPHAGKWAASPAIASDPAFADLAGMIAAGDPTAVDIARAWPPE